MEHGEGPRNQQPQRYHFKNLVLWQKAQAMAADVINIVDKLPSTTASRGIGSQLAASAGSVPANIAEGNGRFSRAAYRNHLSIARGSLWETESWVDLLKRTGRIDSSGEASLLGQFNELTARLTRLMHSLEEQQKKQGPVRIGEPGATYCEADPFDEDHVFE